MNEADVAARLAEALYGDEAPEYLDAPRLAALLPIVREIADQRAAEELEAAATCQLNGSGGRPLGWLRARAAALRGATDA